MALEGREKETLGRNAMLVKEIINVQSPNFVEGEEGNFPVFRNR